MRLVSVVIPVFNRKLFVNEMIKCVLQQTWTNWELILVDDGSTDGTVEMILNYSRIDSKIHVIQRHVLPKGGQTCRNIGLQKAIGDYIVFFDSDDLILPNCLEKRVGFMESNKGIDFGIFPTKSFIKSTNYEKISRYDLFWGIKIKKKDDLSLFYLTKYPFIVVTNIYRRKSLIERGITWDENVIIYQDFDFNISSLKRGLKYKYATSTKEDFDYLYRMSFDPDSTSAQHFSDEKFKSTIYLFTKILKNIEESNKPVYYQKKFFSFFLLYFRYIIFSRSFEYIDNYLNFGNKYYSFFAIYKLRVCAELLKPIKNKITVKNLYVIFLSFSFPRREMLRTILTQIKKIANKTIDFYNYIMY